MKHARRQPRRTAVIVMGAAAGFVFGLALVPVAIAWLVIGGAR